MKKLSIIFLIVILFFSSCKKEESDSNSDDKIGINLVLTSPTPDQKFTFNRDWVIPFDISVTNNSGLSFFKITVSDSATNGDRFTWEYDSSLSTNNFNYKYDLDMTPKDGRVTIGGTYRVYIESLGGGSTEFETYYFKLNCEDENFYKDGRSYDLTFLDTEVKPNSTVRIILQAKGDQLEPILSLSVRATNNAVEQGYLLKDLLFENIYFNEYIDTIDFAINSAMGSPVSADTRFEIISTFSCDQNIRKSEFLPYAP